MSGRLDAVLVFEGGGKLIEGTGKTAVRVDGGAVEGAQLEDDFLLRIAISTDT